MSNYYKLGISPLDISDVYEIINEDKNICLDNCLKEKIISCRKFLNKSIKSNDNLIYGINTGFGSLYNKHISSDDLSKLQENLVLSHACGTGEEVPNVIVKIMMLLKIQSLSFGFSGIQLVTIERLIEMFNNNILPVVYQQGSLGASGDSAPLAHMSLPLIGYGDVRVLRKSSDGQKKYIKIKSSSLIKDKNWDTISLQPKEGLALLNGTQFMSAYAVWSLIISKKLAYFSDLIGSISLEAFDGRSECFDELIHIIRPHKGQLKSAKNIRNFLRDSEIQNSDKLHVQDPYSFRCMPQVHGATFDAIEHVEKIVFTEINSVTDNPTIFVEQEKIISGGNFHGQPLALSMDYLALAVSELGSISERRIFQLISGKRGLPEFLVKKSGLNSGMMIPQYTAASIASQNKQLCSPSSVDSIVSSNGQEDHVSMGANAATKLYKVVKNVEKILSIELLNSFQALDFREKKSSNFIENLKIAFRSEVEFLEDDRLLHEDIKKSIDFLNNLNIDTDLL